VLRLYPAPDKQFQLQGLYLGLGMHRARSAAPFVYCNFLSSLDGRIALSSPDGAGSWVPREIANPGDWRLYQELAAQADILLTSARYFRQFAGGRAQDALPVGPEDAYADLHEWRERHGMSPQPAIAVVSASLDIPLLALEAYRDRSIYILTGKAADAKRVEELQEFGCRVIPAGEGKRVDGRQLVDSLGDLGFRMVYSIAGPAVFHTLLRAGVVNDLFLTTSHQILAGEGFHTLIRGPELNPAASFKLRSLYYDVSPGDQAQFFSRFSCPSNQAC